MISFPAKVLHLTCSNFKLPIMLQLRCGEFTKKDLHLINLIPLFLCMDYLTAQRHGLFKSTSKKLFIKDLNVCPTC